MLRLRRLPPFITSAFVLTISPISACQEVQKRDLWHRSAISTSQPHPNGIAKCCSRLDSKLTFTTFVSIHTVWSAKCESKNNSSSDVAIKFESRAQTHKTGAHAKKPSPLCSINSICIQIEHHRKIPIKKPLRKILKLAGATTWMAL